MKFSEYFNDWLYGNEGYYSDFKKIGKDGDFYTAVSTSKFFGGSIAKYIIKTIADGFLSPNTTILEIGAHQGYLLADIIEFINTLEPKLLSTLKFAIVERHEKLREIQKQYIEESFGGTIQITHFDDLKNVKLDEAFVIANEIFDAFSCELVWTKDEQLLQAEVYNHQIVWGEASGEINEICKKHKITKGEVIIGVDEFAQTLSDNIHTFEFMSFDYGELYPRNDFSIRIYKSHNVHPLFEENLKLEDFFKSSDITFDVNFAQISESFDKVKVDKHYYATQLKALVEMGITELLEMVLKHAGQNAYLREANKAKTLLNPIGMGERFKVISFRQRGKNETNNQRN